MAVRQWTLVEFTEGEVLAVIHKPGCAMVRQDVADGGSKELVKLDLEVSDEELLDALDPGGEDLEDISQVEICSCTGYVTEEPPVAQAEQADEEDEEDGDDEEEDELASPPSSAAARASQQAARERLLRQVEDAVEKLVAERGVDDIGEGDQWAEERLATCKDDYVYDLAVEVRKLRERGDSWWRVAYELHLPGSGASNKQGRKGSAFARRLWRAAWGKTYLGERGQRESKVSREARALENLGRPYFSEDVSDAEVIKLVTGRMLHWVTRLPVKDGLVVSAQEAYVHHDPRLVMVRQGPKGRYLEFFEQVDAAQLQVDPRLAIAKSGPQRAVYVDRITRVGV